MYLTWEICKYKHWYYTIHHAMRTLLITYLNSISVLACFSAHPSGGPDPSERVLDSFTTFTSVMFRTCLK